jgi:hypothetical protein
MRKVRNWIVDGLWGIVVVYADLWKKMQGKSPEPRLCRFCYVPHDLSVPLHKRILHYAGWWP